MNLKELQAMIKEELDAYVGEQEELEVDVDTDAGDVDAMGGDDEDLLRKIFDMLKDKFEAEEDVDDDEEADEDMMGEVKDDDEKNESADMEEAASTGFGDAGAKNTSGKDSGYTPAKTTKGDGKLHENVKRFQKLANIIK